MSSSRKKVVLRKLSRDWVAGYIPPADFVRNGKIELLDLAGKVTTYALADLKWLCFVRDFNSGEAGNPERLLRRNFAGRPRGEGLWLRLQLRDADTIEGLAANDLSLLEADGIFLTPPDTRSNTQRMYIPRDAITSLEIVAVIGSRGRQKPRPASAQESLFSSESPPESAEG